VQRSGARPADAGLRQPGSGASLASRGRGSRASRDRRTGEEVELRLNASVGAGRGGPSLRSAHDRVDLPQPARHLVPTGTVLVPQPSLSRIEAGTRSRQRRTSSRPVAVDLLTS
jgi:hypothetical protein